MIYIGSVYSLQTPCLGNEVGAIGVCYEEYQDFDHPDKKGISIIFENGEYDGFAFDEKYFLAYLGKVSLEYPEIINYEFTNVMQLSRDFDNGLFTSAIKQFKNVRSS
jgi:hypothetical protein